jgi:hypothetical protein
MDVMSKLEAPVTKSTGTVYEFQVLSTFDIMDTTIRRSVWL